jgi:hypothetical protein
LDEFLVPRFICRAERLHLCPPGALCHQPHRRHPENDYQTKCRQEPKGESFPPAIRPLQADYQFIRRWFGHGCLHESISDLNSKRQYSPDEGIGNTTPSDFAERAGFEPAVRIDPKTAFPAAHRVAAGSHYGLLDTSVDVISASNTSARTYGGALGNSGCARMLWIMRMQQERGEFAR